VKKESGQNRVAPGTDSSDFGHWENIKMNVRVHGVTGIIERDLLSQTGIDPVRLLQQIHAMQDALWKHAIDWPTGEPSKSPRHTPAQPRRFEVAGCVAGAEDSSQVDSARIKTPGDGQKRKYNKSPRKPRERGYRTRIDPFAAVAEELYAWLRERPERNAKDLLKTLQDQYPGEYPEHLLRTLQRRIQRWRTTIILAFDDHLIDEDIMASRPLALMLTGIECAPAPGLAAANPVI